MGYGDFIETSKSGDGGIDGIINEDKLGLDKIYIQAKRYNENKVREKEIRNFIEAANRLRDRKLIKKVFYDFYEAIKVDHTCKNKISSEAFITRFIDEYQIIKRG